MKGPALRVNGAGERLWVCPQTGFQFRTRADVTALASPFAQGRWMTLVDPPNGHRPVVPIENFVAIMDPAPDLPQEPTPEAEVVSQIEHPGDLTVEDVTSEFLEMEEVDQDDESEFGDGLLE